MNSLTDLREVVDVVIGVDTHVHTHSAAVLDTATGGVLDEITVEATAEGYAELVEFAKDHPMLRAWAIEGTGGHGAGLSRHLLESSEIVIELDRPKRAARRNGAKSDPLMIRAAREAMARPRLGTPRTGGERQALSVLLAARRSAINASTEAQQQVFSLVIAAPEPIRVRFPWSEACRDARHRCASLRVHASWATETASTVVALRTLARRAHAMLKEARGLQKAILAIIRSWRPICSPARRPYRRRADKVTTGIGSTATAIATSTTHCTPWCRFGSNTSQPPATTSPAAQPKARPAERSNAAWPATSPATSTAYSKAGSPRLDRASTSRASGAWLVSAIGLIRRS